MAVLLSLSAKLALSGLRVWFGAEPVLHGISLECPDRSITALLGPSGCGKSTLLRAVNRLHELSPGVRMRGRILLGGRDTARMPAEELRTRVGMLFQRPNPFPMSIRQNVAFGPALWGVRGRELDRIVTHSLQRAALWEEVRTRLDGSALALSGGQQQRLCLARALALEPEVLLLDEPTSALDPAATHAVEELIRALGREMTIILVTHSLPQARRLAARAALLAGGRLLESGPAEQVLVRPRSVEAARFLAS